ncbi:MAG: hypothetical protein MHM6MM_006550, partial [Cercozoa sp. M6MM]
LLGDIEAQADIVDNKIVRNTQRAERVIVKSSGKMGCLCMIVLLIVMIAMLFIPGKK